MLDSRAIFEMDMGFCIRIMAPTKLLYEIQRSSDTAW